MPHLFTLEELEAARAAAAALVSPAPAPAPFTYRPRSEEQITRRAHQSWRGASTAKPRKPRTGKQATLDALVDAANRTSRVCARLTEKDFDALRSEIAAYRENPDSDRFLKEEFPNYLAEVIADLTKVRDFLRAMAPEMTESTTENQL